jgi:hypothetical protein
MSASLGILDRTEEEIIFKALFITILQTQSGLNIAPEYLNFLHIPMIYCLFLRYYSLRIENIHGI